MDFVMVGFSQTDGFRRFTFERVESDRSRTTFTVSANLLVIRRLGIRIQELPLMCRQLLLAEPEAVTGHAIEFSEEQLRRAAIANAAPAHGSKKQRAAALAAAALTPAVAH